MEIAVAHDVGKAIDAALNIPVHPDSIVLVRQHPDWPGYLLFDVGDDNAQEFFTTYRSWISRFMALNELFMLEPFCEQLQADGYHVIFDPDCAEILDNHRRWSKPLTVANFSFIDRRTGESGQLFPYQNFTLQRALERAQARARDDRFFFYGWGTGCIQGDAEISLNRGGKGFRMKLRDVVSRFNGEPGRYQWDLSVPTYVQREVNGVIRLGEIQNAWRSGVKTTYTVTTESGRTLRATGEHPFLTERGWLRLDQLEVGDQLHVRGTQTSRGPRAPKSHYRIERERVASVALYGQEETFDIEVKGDPHNFLANGIVVHNTGKTMAAAAGAQELVNRGQIDLVMAFTLSHMRTNYQRFFNNTTALSAVVVEGTKDRRRKLYGQNHQVFVNNYAKLRFDKELMAEVTEGDTVLWVLDEVQELTTGSTKNSWRKGLDELVKGKDIVWPMTASAVEETPMKYRDIFELSGGSKPNPLGTQEDFKRRYIRSENRRPAVARHGGTFWIVDRKWNKAKLHEVRHRVGDRTQNARKTDPGVRENFKGLTCERLDVQLSPQHREIYDYVTELAQEALYREESTVPHYNLLRYIANNAAGLRHTSEALAAEVLQRFPQTHQSEFATKLEVLGEQLETIRDQGDKAIVFTHWTNLGTNLIHDYLTRRKISHVLHTGELTPRDAQKAQDDFKARDDIAVFLSSDAGSHGLNLPEAKYVISYECPYSYDVLHQRNSRVDRADSHLEGYTAYVYVAEDTLETRIWDVMEERRAVAEATTGATETLSYGHLAEDDEADHPQTRDWLIFGRNAA